MAGLYNPLIDGVQFMSAGIPMGGNDTVGVSAPNTVVIDGTPVRVVVLALAAAAGLTALRWAGFRFNVGVSS